MMLRYISGTGAEGMKVSPEVGRQLYSDIQEQRLFQDPEYRSLQINSPNNPAYMRENILRGNTPVYYGGLSDSPAPHRAQLPTDKGERWQLSKQLGLFGQNPIGMIKVTQSMRVMTLATPRRVKEVLKAERNQDSSCLQALQMLAVVSLNRDTEHPLSIQWTSNPMGR